MTEAADRRRNWTRRSLAAGLGLSALVLSTGSLGNLSRALNGTLVVAALLGLAVLLITPGSVGRRRTALSLLMMALALPIVARGETLGSLATCLFFFGLSLTATRDEGMATALALTALLFSLYGILVAYVPSLWHVQQWLAIYFSWFVGVGLMLGPTALGLPIFVLFALFALSVFFLAIPRRTPNPSLAPRSGPALDRKNPLLLLAWLAALVLALVAYIWLQPPLASLLVRYWPAPPTSAQITSPLPSITYLESPLLLFVLLWLVSAIAGLWLRPRPLPLFAPRHSARWTTAGLALLSLGTLVLTLEPPYSLHRGTILIHDTGHVDWGRPAFGQYGAHSGGAFGLLPDYLAAYGYKARTGSLTAQNLEGARAVVLINLPEKLNQDEKDRLLAFVQAGGGLIIWGEHTGLGRIREPINDLLSALPGEPIYLNFDSAVPIRQGWAEGLTLLPHPAAYGVRDAADLVIAVGASLDIRPPARPIIVGRFGHSDAGDATNQALNYVGDMRYNPGERLGDVVLAAEVRYGDGHIVVLGDTTPLGSVNLMTTMPFHARLLDWLTADRSAVWNLISHNAWLAALLLLASGACLLRGPSRIVLAGAAVAVGLTLALTTYVNDRQAAPSLPRGPVVYIDISHQERFDRLLWEETSIGGLNYNLVRNGVLPLLLRKVDDRTLAQARLQVLVAPGQPLSTREVKTVARWVENGGRLLVSVGWEEGQASESLLSAFGLHVDNIPLGPAQVDRTTGLVQFHEAWPVAAEHRDAQTIVEDYGYPLILYQPWGKGGVVLIGDSEFLLGGTLEGQTRYQEGNILLLRDILQRYLRSGTASALSMESVSAGEYGSQP
jgi:hypothetical protein